ncbi:hypothetical protein LTR22_027386 [Elasticomyces elasticus]|nr:hypothetical protein LTR22_027386 [Elasticomyces elasticus]
MALPTTQHQHPPQGTPSISSLTNGFAIISIPSAIGPALAVGVDARLGDLASTAKKLSQLPRTTGTYSTEARRLTATQLDPEHATLST